MPRLSQSIFSRRFERKRTVSNISDRVSESVQRFSALEREWNVLKREVDGELSKMK